GEAVVAAQVIPDMFRIARSGEVLERTPGLKKIAIRSLPDGGTYEEQVLPELTEALCLSEENLSQLHALASRCEEVYGPSRDIEWAIADGELYLLQCRAVTRAGGASADVVVGDAIPEPGAPVDDVQRVPLFAELSPEATEL